MRLLTTVLVPLTLFLLTACQGVLPPLRDKIEVGRDPYAVFVGGSGLASDLYGVRADGGPAYPITYTPVAEQAPALAPDGVGLVFLRGRSLRDSTPAAVWVMNLMNGAERELRLPKGAGAPMRVGWSRDGATVIVGNSAGLFRIDAPPAPLRVERVSAAGRAAAESSLAVLLGDPVFTQVVPCKTAGDLCVSGDTGAPGFLAHEARQAVRWGPDSVALLIGNRVEIRPLGPGRPRRLTWTNLPADPRQMTYFEGSRERLSP